MLHGSYCLTGGLLSIGRAAKHCAALMQEVLLAPTLGACAGNSARADRDSASILSGRRRLLARDRFRTAHDCLPARLATQSFFRLQNRRFGLLSASRAFHFLRCVTDLVILRRNSFPVLTDTPFSCFHRTHLYPPDATCSARAETLTPLVVRTRSPAPRIRTVTTATKPPLVSSSDPAVPKADRSSAALHGTRETCSSLPDCRHETKASGGNDRHSCGSSPRSP